MSTAADDSSPEPSADGAIWEKQIEDLYDAFHPVVLRKATLAAAGCTADAWDATQHAFIKAWEHLHNLQLNEVVNWKGWLIKTAVRHVLFARRHHPRLAPLDDSEPADSRILLEDHVVLKETYQGMMEAIGQLSARQQQALVLVHIAGCSTAEAAADMGVSASTVRNLIHQARTRLHAATGEASDD
ncbi:RNA polymerase sigma factor [Streptomyces triticiradicis]|uniref:Sigma-70 family RNA polymerase sigma factor n=1 Tax=Streptomyces triticiradicis TaxID=2651189 RepID=A0A7J5DF07_9ACTN|nr:sigma-70 family RNA polymerase sigma factor [Streptomyces triticiradicis]KAB1987449.1 sigma-70 family RNA polymerase sigma factor [Streptomyces triticiradicis]